jgi:hypothetical protein
MNTTCETRTQENQEYLIAVQLHVDAADDDLAEALRLAWPGSNVGATSILTELLATAFDAAGIKNRTVHDATELNIALIICSVDRLGDALAIIQKKLERVNLLKLATIAYVDARESAVRDGEMVLHWRNHYPATGGLDLNTVMTPEVRAQKQRMVESRHARMRQLIVAMRGQ